MFGKKNESKVKELSPREAAMKRITEEVEQLRPEEILIYKLPQFYWSEFAAFLMCELNPSYPGEGQKKYIMSIDKIADGKPAGQKNRIQGTNKPGDFAEWVAKRDGMRFS